MEARITELEARLAAILGTRGAVRETTFEILTQGDVHMLHRQGYMVAGNDDAVCFYIDAQRCR
jgi:translation initiation factor 1 (eIF-1/SUI1)